MRIYHKRRVDFHPVFVNTMRGRKIQVMVCIFFMGIFLSSALSPVYAFGLDDIKEMFGGKWLFTNGADFFNDIIAPAKELLRIDFAAPSESSGLGAIYETSLNIMGMFRVCAVTMLNTFFFVAFFKDCSDFRQNLTFEIFMTYAVRFLVGNALILNIQKVVEWFCGVGQALVTTVSGSAGEELYLESPFSDADSFDPELAELVPTFLIGFVFLLGCIACGFVICWTVYAAYLKVYFYICVSPLAMSTVSGSHGVSASAVAFAKTFTCAVCEMGAISIALRLGTTLIQNPPIPGDSTVSKAFSSLLAVVIVTGLTKGADTLVRRGFGL